MKTLFAQLILAARNGDGDSWMRILPIVIIGIFYAISSIVKARANKLKEQDQQQPGRKPGFKPKVRTPAAIEGRSVSKSPDQQVQRPIGRTPYRQDSPQVQPPRRKIARPQPAAARKPAVRIEALIQPTADDLLKASEISPLYSPVQPHFGEIPKLTSDSVDKKKDVTKSIVESLLDFDSPDKLKRAILHYEIIGKPLSLRNASEHLF